MNKTNDDRKKIYEIGYLIGGNIPEEKVGEEVEKVKNILVGANASVIGEEAPHHQELAYTIRRKTVAGSYEKFDEAYFGWIKFEMSSSDAEAVKKAVENIPSIIRMLLLITVRENTYLGKRAPAVLSKQVIGEEKVAPVVISPDVLEKPATIEEMDKSIDDMVKEA
jgi:ribosomal protein S6